MGRHPLLLQPLRLPLPLPLRVQPVSSRLVGKGVLTLILNCYFVRLLLASCPCRFPPASANPGADAAGDGAAVGPQVHKGDAGGV